MLMPGVNARRRDCDRNAIGRSWRWFGSHCDLISARYKYNAYSVTSFQENKSSQQVERSPSACYVKLQVVAVATSPPLKKIT